MPNQTGGYAFEHSLSRGGGDRGVLTENERRTLEKERRAAQIPAEAAAASAMQASVDAILNGDSPRTPSVTRYRGCNRPG
jgi:hypothetical protein